MSKVNDNISKKYRQFEAIIPKFFLKQFQLFSSLSLEVAEVRASHATKIPTDRCMAKTVLSTHLFDKRQRYAPGGQEFHRELFSAEVRTPPDSCRNSFPPERNYLNTICAYTYCD